MKTFLELVAEELIPLPPEKVLVIFPTQRACREFRRLYSGKKKSVSRLPVILPVAELLENLSAPGIADELTLILKLKEVYDRYFIPDNFDSFLPYAQQLLNDFNEIDRQMLIAEHLFQEVKDMKELDERFSPDSEESMFIRNFWSEFLAIPLTPLQSSFLTYWKQLPELYKGLREELRKSEMAYEGMAWRHVAETIAAQRYFDVFDKIVFAGFYALNTSEEIILNYLQKKGKLSIYIDADKLYVDNNFHEAGHFLRRGFFKDGNYNWIQNQLSIPKESYIVKGCNGRFSMAREVAQSLLQDLEVESQTGIKKSRIIVLADETLLYPLLHQASISGIPLNASMGFPLKHHPVYRLLQLIRSARNYSSHEQTEVLKTRLCTDFSSDPLIASMMSHRDSEGESHFLTERTKEIEKLLFPDTLDINTEADRIIQFIRQFNIPKENWMFDVHLHSIHALETGIRLLALHQQELSITAWWQLLMDHFGRQRVPFLSDKEKGIPVVGFLESRIIDFDVVYIAPLNEGALPSLAVSKSLIPYSLRKAYHLPCKEEQDAVTAYHFYRLLQRASDIRFFYNTDLNATGGGERSRYLFQIQNDIFSRFAPKQMKYLLQHSKVEVMETNPIIIRKSTEIIDKLRNKFNGLQNAAGNIGGLSASAINTYISCSLKFYYDQVAGIRPEDEQHGLIGGNFGNALHKSMEKVYAGPGRVDNTRIIALQSEIESLVDESVKEVYDLPATTGHDYLMKGVIIELVKRILKYDQINAPFEIIGLEENLHVIFQTAEGHPVALKGIIDRIDQHEGILRILDYKTGGDKVSDPEDECLLFKDPAHKVTLQLMIYALLVAEYYPDIDLPLKAGIFRMRQFDEGVEWINNNEAISGESIATFKSGILELIEEIYNPEIPFVQTEDPDRCRFCDYNRLCCRTV